MKYAVKLKNEEVAKRFRFCRRNLIDKTISELSKNHSFSYSTLTKWESGSLLITPKNIDKIIKMFNSEGVNCSRQWLLYGEGAAAFSVQKEKNVISFENIISEPTEITNQITIFNEVEFFRRNNPSSLIKLVIDESMVPLYKIGDYVGGTKVDPEFYPLIDQEYCIIKFPSNNYYIRQFFISETTYVLLPLQPSKKFPPLVIKDEIFDLYVISYHRKDFSCIFRKSLDDVLLKV